MDQKSNSLVLKGKELEGSELSFDLPFNTHFEVLARGSMARKHRVTIWFQGKNTHTRFEQEEEGLFGRDIFLTAAEGNEGSHGFPVNVRIESKGDGPEEDWTVSRMRMDPDKGPSENFMLVESIDSGSESESWNDCNIQFEIVK